MKQKRTTSILYKEQIIIRYGSSGIRIEHAEARLKERFGDGFVIVAGSRNMSSQLKVGLVRADIDGALEWITKEPNMRTMTANTQIINIIEREE